MIPCFNVVVVEYTINWQSSIPMNHPIAVDSLFCTANHAQKEYFDVAWANQIPLYQATVFEVVRVWFHVSFVEKLLIISPLHNTLSSSSTLFCRCNLRASLTRFRIYVRCRRERRPVHASLTVMCFLMPMLIFPLSPTTSIKTPILDQSSYQKEALAPFLTSTLQNFFARSLYLSSFFHIQEPRFVVAFTDQNVSCLSKYFSIHRTHKEFVCETILQINFKQLTSYTSLRDLKLSPPSCFSLHRASQQILVVWGFKSGPDQRKAEQSLSITWMHSLGSLNAASQKLQMLLRTEVTKFNRPS